MAHAPTWRLVVRVVLLLAFSGGAVGAETVSLEPLKDNTLYEDPDGARSNGEGTQLFAGRASGSDLGRRRRALLAFDVAGNVPAGATIVSARLTLNMSHTISGNLSMTLHRVLADWGEASSNALGEEGMGAPAASGDATWLHRFFGTDMRWSTAGGDFVAAASATRSVDAVGSYSWGPSAEMAADVQGWLDAPATSFGWILIGDEVAQPSSKRFSSRENSAPARPRLEIEFASAGQPTTTATPEEPSPTTTETPLPPATETSSPAPTSSATVSPSHTPEPTATPTPTPTQVVATPTLPRPCAGDCDRNQAVSLAEAVRGIDIALGRGALNGCEPVDANADALVTIDEVVLAIRNALRGCSAAD